MIKSIRYSHTPMHNVYFLKICLKSWPPIQYYFCWINHRLVHQKMWMLENISHRIFTVSISLACCNVGHTRND